MHDFNDRMNQLLATLDKFAPGHRKRLLRPVRQHEIECWPEGVSEDAANAMKVAMRVAVHDLLDQFCFQLEAVLTRSDDDATRVAVMALTAVAMSDGMRVAFRDGNSTTGLTYPGSETLIIEILPASRLRIEYVSTASSTLSRQIEPPAADSDDPFAAARAIIDEFRERSKKATDQHG